MTEMIKHPEFGEIRTVMRKGEPWFVGLDVCEALGLRGKGSDNFRPLDEDEKTTQKMSTPGGVQELVVINESGLYTLIMRSNKPEARKFRKWVTSEVLPSIRRNGFYVHPDMMSRKDEQRLRKLLGERINSYLTDNDHRAVAKKFGISEWQVGAVVRGASTNNAVMQECQQRALLNKEKELNAYHPARMREVLNKLSR